MILHRRLLSQKTNEKTNVIVGSPHRMLALFAASLFGGTEGQTQASKSSYVSSLTCREYPVLLSPRLPFRTAVV